MLRLPQADRWAIPAVTHAAICYNRPPYSTESSSPSRSTARRIPCANRAKERTSEDNTSSSVDTATEPMERVKARLTELSERLAGSATASKPGAR